MTGCFIHFKTVNRRCLDRAWYSFASQPWRSNDTILVLDNNSDESPQHWQQRLDALKPASRLMLSRHTDERRTHPWAVNTICKAAPDSLIFLSRSDYILAPSALADLSFQASRGEGQFASGWIYQSAYDRDQKDLPPFDIDQLRWQDDWRVLVDATVPGYTFYETNLDAGVWACERSALERAGWLNEDLWKWGYAQSTFQRALTNSGTPCSTLPWHIAFHQQHGVWDRDHDAARAQYNEAGGGV